MAHNESKAVIYAALVGNLAIAVTKLGASFYTGSSAMLTESIHSFVDTGNQGLLLFGLKRAARPPDERHPFGHGLELYFWSFVVALLIFALGGAFSIYEGVQKIMHPEPIESAWVNFAVLGVSVLFEGYSFSVAYREFRKTNQGVPLFKAIQRSKDPSVFAVLLEDSAALIGLVIAMAGVGAAVWLDLLVADGAASIAIGALLVGTAGVLGNETRSLLTGESASRGVLADARKVIEEDARVNAVESIATLQLGPAEVLMAVTLELRDDLDVAAVAATAKSLRARMDEAQPIVSHLFFRLTTMRPGRQPARQRE